MVKLLFNMLNNNEIEYLNIITILNINKLDVCSTINNDIPLKECIYVVIINKVIHRIF